MNIVRTVIIVLLVFLGAAAGIAKIMQMPQELEFFQALSLSGSIVTVFGIVQLAGAVLLALRRVRLIGAIISDVTFTLSAVMIYLHGQIGFALVALLPAILAGVIVFEEIRRSSREAANESDEN